MMRKMKSIIVSKKIISEELASPLIFLFFDIN